MTRTAEVAPSFCEGHVCDVEENNCLRRRLCSHCEEKIGVEEEWRGEEWSNHGGRDHVLTISGRRTLYGLTYSTAVTLADSASYGSSP